MKNSIKKWQVIIAAITLCLLTLSALPTFHQATQISKEAESPQWMSDLGLKPIKLGLDLNGGVLFVLHVDTEKAQSEYIQSLQQEIKQIAREAKFRGLTVKKTEQDSLLLTFSGSAVKNAAAFLSLANEQIGDVEIRRQSDSQFLLSMTELAQKTMHQNLMDQSVSTMRDRIESLGITEAITQRQGKNKIRIELPGVKDPQQAERILGTTASLDVYPMVDSPSEPNRIFRDEQGQQVRVAYQKVFTGSNIKAASSGRDEMGQPLVNLVLDAKGGAKMSAFTKENIGEPMVTVFSEYHKNALGETIKSSKVINVATIQAQLGNRFSITNLSSPTEAQELAMLLNAGSLNAPVSILEKRTITATLGEKNVSSGLAALGLGIGFTLLFMALWYRKLGLIANVSLLTNLICLVGLMALLPGLVLTLPGIAGFVLTVGMAVDTNVLIFERIKEERLRGHSNLTAINAGYQRAFGTILDANVTTMICALILLTVGYGPVKGFAMTLTLGLLTSMFSGVFVARITTQYFAPQVNTKVQEPLL